MDVARLGLSDVPLDVLLKIFSLLPLRALLKLEHLCQTLQRAVAVYLSTVKRFNPYGEGVLEDEFLPFENNSKLCGAICDGNIARLLARCPNVAAVTFLPARARVDAVPAMVELLRRGSILHLELCDSWQLAEPLLRECPHVSIGELRLEGTGSEMLRLAPNCRVRRIHLRGVTLDRGVPALNETEEISLTRVTLHLPATPESGVQQFHRLRSFSFSGTTFARDRAHLHTSTVALLTSLAAAPHLDTLRLSMGGFDELRDVCRLGGYPSLRCLDLSCPVWFESSSPQQSSGAVVVAELCALSRASLRHLRLPSVVMVKQFFMFILGNNIWFPCLETLGVGDNVYDTKFFLAPFNFVEDRVYDNFVQRFPQLTSLSLHSYSGSLKPGVLRFPVHLTRLTLPWDSRRPSTQSWVDVAAIVGSLPLLTHLHLAGVESVEGVGEAAKLAGGKEASSSSVIKLDSPLLREVKVSNVCCSKIVLTGCSGLVRFALQCCPVLRSLSLPTSVEDVSVYDEGRPYTMKFVEGWLSQLKHAPNGPARRIHVQLHSLHKAGTEVPTEKGKGLLPEIVLGFSRSLNYLVVYRHARRELHHSARDSMYACTEFQPQSEFNPAAPGSDPGNNNSRDEVAEENEHRALVARGLSRWLRHFSAAPPQTVAPLVPKAAPLDPRAAPFDPKTAHLDPKSGAGAAEKAEFEAVFCGQLYNCYTNLPALVEANTSPYLTQPSSSSSSSSGSHDVGGGGVRELNVPRLGLCATPPLNGKPLVCVSVMEYLHHILHPRD